MGREVDEKTREIEETRIYVEEIIRERVDVRDEMVRAKEAHQYCLQDFENLKCSFEDLNHLYTT